MPPAEFRHCVIHLKVPACENPTLDHPVWYHIVGRVGYQDGNHLAHSTSADLGFKMNSRSIRTVLVVHRGHHLACAFPQFLHCVFLRQSRIYVPVRSILSHSPSPGSSFESWLVFAMVPGRLRHPVRSRDFVPPALWLALQGNPDHISRSQISTSFSIPFRLLVCP